VPRGGPGGIAIGRLLRQGALPERSWRKLPRLTWRALRIILSVSPGRFALTTATQLLTAVGLGAFVLETSRAASSVFEAAAVGSTVGAVLADLVPLALVTLVLQAAQIARNLASHDLRLAVTREVQVRVAEVAAHVELQAFEHPEFFDRLTRANQSSSVMALPEAVIGVPGGLLATAGVSLALVTIDPVLLVLVALAAVPGAVASLRSARQQYEQAVAYAQTMRELEYVRRLLVGRDEAKEVRAFGLARHLLGRLHDLIAKEHRARSQVQRASVRRGLVGTAVGGAVFGGALLVLLVLLLRGTIGLPGATAALVAMQQSRRNWESTLGSVTRVADLALYLEDLLWFLDLNADHPDDFERIAPFQRLTVDHVTFRYPDTEQPALREVSLAISAGEVVALVGENGSGKTTLAKLLARLYVPDEGAVSWDGVDTAELDPRAVAEHTAIVFQDHLHYQVSAADNVRFGRVERGDGHNGVEEAVTVAGADFLHGLPQGLDTVLGREFGATDLSTGQWQRVAIARAFYRDAPFLVLDEPTAALDPIAEHALFEKVRALFAGRAVVLISHRFATVANADRIVVLREGQVIEQGTHRELMRLGGHYAAMFSLQAAAYVDGMRGESAGAGAEPPPRSPVPQNP